MSRRAFVVVLDACGVGALPDADAYGDAGTNTLAHLAERVGGLRLPVLQSLGLGSIVPLAGVPPADAPAVHGRLHALGPGKDSTTGHWELMGVVTPVAPPTYPDGFPSDVLADLEALAGRPFLCNRPYDGVSAIEDFGAEHLATGAPILYTSQDSVLQVAAHRDVLAEDALHDLCAAIRERMGGRHAVARVIARPFTGSPGAFRRTPGRRDFSVAPPSRSYLEAIGEAGVPVHAVGKVADLFAGAGIDHAHRGTDTAQALASTSALLSDLEHGLVVTNLIDTDQVFGHRKDADGFHASLQAVDAAVGGWLTDLRPGDLLVLTADHGCDVAAPHTDHTREHVPLLGVAAGVEGRRHDGPLADVGATALAWLTGRQDPGLPGGSFL